MNIDSFVNETIKDIEHSKVKNLNIKPYTKEWAYIFQELTSYYLNKDKTVTLIFNETNPAEFMSKTNTILEKKYKVKDFKRFENKLNISIMYGDDFDIDNITKYLDYKLSEKNENIILILRADCIKEFHNKNGNFSRWITMIHQYYKYRERYNAKVISRTMRSAV